MLCRPSVNEGARALTFRQAGAPGGAPGGAGGTGGVAEGLAEELRGIGGVWGRREGACGACASSMR